ncbi:MAG: LuxR C-terminal-related transcriptional regulator [Candidatus Competibacteraceae bacterium]
MAPGRRRSPARGGYGRGDPARSEQIADELGIGERTVKAQCAQLMAKLEVGSVAELGRLAERLKNLSD